MSLILAVKPSLLFRLPPRPLFVTLGLSSIDTVNMTYRSSSFSRFFRSAIKSSSERHEIKPLYLPALVTIRERAAKDTEELLKTALAHRQVSSPVLVSGTRRPAHID